MESDSGTLSGVARTVSRNTGWPDSVSGVYILEYRLVFYSSGIVIPIQRSRLLVSIPSLSIIPLGYRPTGQHRSRTSAIRLSNWEIPYIYSLSMTFRGCLASFSLLCRLLGASYDVHKFPSSPARCGRRPWAAGSQSLVSPSGEKPVRGTLNSFC